MVARDPGTLCDLNFSLIGLLVRKLRGHVTKEKPHTHFLAILRVSRYRAHLDYHKVTTGQIPGELVQITTK